MAFDKKAWNEANKEKNRLYSVRHRLRKKGLDLPAETLEEFAAYREAKKTASKERERARKKAWAQANKERKNAKYRERYHSDPEFRAKEIAKRLSKLPRLSDEEKSARRGQRLEAREREREARRCEREAARLKARKEANAKRHAEAVARAEKIPPRKEHISAPRPVNPTNKSRKPGRLVALSGWMGW